ncbi:LAMI_0H10088g1_1 [Lachancea mirantina]|uniref:Elongation factor 1 alpha-like protein n=1 Tax=Lachancea mirantina TaxID=1230905 RepID=A0A1G4KGG7_9SACH|nr:LAMI_0H10088g1_1 [Lachancea mirantina]
MFPRAKKELSEYQGWTNLSVKLAIFDSEFDFDQAMKELRRTLKKKKQPEGDNGSLSLLERLARHRALEAEKVVSLSRGSSLSTSGALQKLQDRKGRKVDARVYSSTGSSLAQRLASLQQVKGTFESNLEKPMPSGLSAFLNRNQQSALPSGRSTATSSLSARLSALNTARQNSKPEDGKPLKSKPKQPEIRIPELAQTEKSPNFQKLCRLHNINLKRPSKTKLDNNTKRYKITKVIGLHSTKSLLENDESLLSSVFYPATNSKAVQKAAVGNFKKPSPDDVVLEAQKQAFDQLEDLTDNYKQMAIDEEAEEQPVEGSGHEAARVHKKATEPTKPKSPLDLTAYLSKRKPHLSFVVLGHVDAGKSTLMGRLLYDIGAVDNKLIRKLKRESEVVGKSSFHLAWVMDQTQEERSRGVTVDICTSSFETKEADFTIVDAPGHRDFVPNAITGISLVDVAVLSVDCSTDAFESGFNLDGQTKEHTILARSLGIHHLIVALNKMDTVDWYEGRFRDIQFELRNFFESIGLKEENISWIPLSGLSGEGVVGTKYPLQQTWYKGPSLVGELECIARTSGSKDQATLESNPFLFSILDVSPSGKNGDALLSGKVEAGKIQAGETITIYPSEQSVLIENIYNDSSQNPQAAAIEGDFVTLKVKSAQHEDIKTGDIAAIVGYDVGTAQEFTARLLTFKLDRPLLPGTPFILFRGGTQQPARIKRLVSIVDKADPAKVIKKKVKHIGSNQAAVVELELTEKKRRIPLMTLEENKHLSKVLLRKEGRTIAAGAIMSLDF